MKRLLEVSLRRRSFFLLSMFLRGTPAFFIGHKQQHPKIVAQGSTPVIGILSQPGWNSQSQYIAASYVKWLEAGGARSIPIPYDASPALLDDLFGQINGLLLPGGKSDMPPGVPYLLDKIVDSNKQGNYFPVWGTCLGFEFLVKHVGGDRALEDGFKSENISLPLEGVQRKELYANHAIYKTVVDKAVTMNNHHQGIEPDQFLQNDKLTSVWNITSTNHDESGRPFVSTIEPVDPLNFPIYGVQYHPEKNAFEYSTYPGTNIPYEAIDHSEAGLAFSLYLSRFFVDLVREGQTMNRQNHDYTKSDIYPTINTYPMQTGLKFEQLYIIPNASHWKRTIGSTKAINDKSDSTITVQKSALRSRHVDDTMVKSEPLALL